jgi:hypothetical protein
MQSYGPTNDYRGVGAGCQLHLLLQAAQSVMPQDSVDSSQVGSIPPIQSVGRFGTPILEETRANR